MLWAVYCIDKPNTAATRDQYLQVHRDYLDTAMSYLFFSGPLQTDDAGASLGSLFILNAQSRDEAQRFVDGEPFNKVGVFEKVTIHRMRKGRFNAHIADVP